MTKKEKIILLILVGVTIVAAAVFVGIYKYNLGGLIHTAPGNSNRNTARMPLPESRTITPQDRKDLGLAEGIDGVIKYAYKPDGSVMSYVEITKDTRPADDDGDGLSNDLEAKLGTDPKNPDTDRDGLLDGDEVRIGTNPKKVDTDGDKVNDGTEVKYCLDPLKLDTLGNGKGDAANLKAHPEGFCSTAASPTNSATNSDSNARVFIENVNSTPSVQTNSAQ